MLCPYDPNQWQNAPGWIRPKPRVNVKRPGQIAWATFYMEEARGVEPSEQYISWAAPEVTSRLTFFSSRLWASSSKRLGDLLDHLERIGDAPRPEGIPDIVDFERSSPVGIPSPDACEHLQNKTTRFKLTWPK